jgi:hypothetical protein
VKFQELAKVHSAQSLQLLAGVHPMARATSADLILRGEPLHELKEFDFTAAITV